jgi:hypothetical protein
MALASYLFLYRHRTVYSTRILPDAIAEGTFEPASIFVTLEAGDDRHYSCANKYQTFFTVTSADLGNFP